MRLPKPGTKLEDLKCKTCGKPAKDQPDNMNDCTNTNCPYPKEPKAK